VNVDRGDGIKIAVKSVDEFCDIMDVKRVDFIKIDVEGMEIEVVEGALRTIESNLPFIYYETRKEFEEMRNRKIFMEIEQILSKIIYEFFTAESRDGELEEIRYPDLTYNTLAIPHSSERREIMDRERYKLYSRG